MNRKLIFPALGIVSLALASAAVLSAVRAEETSTSSPIIQKLAQKFNLKEEDVKSVFDEFHQERFQEMQKMKEERLNQAVEDGVISETQKQALLERFKQLSEERAVKRQETQQWLADQGIDPEKLAPYLGFGHHRGFGGMGMMEAR